MLRLLLIILLNITLLLTGCSGHRGSNATSATQNTRYRHRADGAPALSQVPKNIHKIPDAIPKVEPKSKYGNPASYVVLRKKYHVMASSAGYKSTGRASWYGTKFHGYRTSSGELYDMYKMTAAHKTLPLPTYVQVKNLETGKKIIVKVNDRGPFHGDRLLDLSYAAAAKLEILGGGTGRIEVTALNPRQPHQQNCLLAAKKTPPTPPKLITKTTNNQPEKTLALNKINNTVSIYKYLQLGAFSNKSNAESLRLKILQLAGRNLPVNVQMSANQHPSVFRVRIGPISNHNLLTALKHKIVNAKLPVPIALP